MRCLLKTHYALNREIKIHANVSSLGLSYLDSCVAHDWIISWFVYIITRCNEYIAEKAIIKFLIGLFSLLYFFISLKLMVMTDYTSIYSCSIILLNALAYFDYPK